MTIQKIVENQEDPFKKPLTMLSGQDLLMCLSRSMDDISFGVAEVGNLDLEDELLDFTADLLTLKANQPFVGKLLAQPKGQWVNVAEIAPDIAQMSQTLMALEASSGGRLQATWLNQPETSDDYCLVLFFMESLGWNNLAVYHRKLATC